MTSPQRLALFDFDGTLCAGNSLHLFMQHMLSSRRGVSRLITWSLLRKLRLAGSRRFKEGVLGVIRGDTEAELQELGREIYIARIRPRLRQAGLKELAGLQQQGYRVMLVTGAFDFLMSPFGEEHGITDMICCRIVRQNGKCTGSIEATEMIGEEKVRAIHNKLNEEEVDWPGSRAYTDDASDRPMLALVGERFHIRGTTGGIVGAKTLDWNETFAS